MTRRNVLKGAKLNLCHAVLAVAIGTCLSPQAALALEPNAPITYNIPAGDLGTAVDAFSRQSGLQILYKPELVSGKRARAVAGKLTSTDALSRLIEGSGLEWGRVNESTLVLRLKALAPQKKGNEWSKNADQVSADPEITTLPEMLVRGSRSLNADIERTQDDIQPYVVLDREDIDLSPASNIEEFLTTRLPMNQSRGTFSRNLPEGDEGNRSNFSLRGLGANQTLILINGRRAPGVSTLRTGDLGQPDLNGIPLSAVERIEILPTTASGIYGGGATGGVINIVLKKDYVGTEVRFTYDNTFDTDSARRKLEVSSGFSLENGRTSIMISGSISDANDLLVGDRDFARRGRELLQRNSPETLANWYLFGSQTNIFGESNLVLDDGTSLGSLYANVPVGYAGGDAGHGLLTGLNIEIPNTIAGGRQSLASVPKTTSGSLSIRREFSDSIEGYVDYGKYRNESDIKWAGFQFLTSISDTDPGNPFDQPIYVSVPLGDQRLERSSVAVSENDRLNAGFILKLPQQWSASLDLNRSSSSNSTQQQPNNIDYEAVNAAIRSGELNVFRDLTLFPLDISPYMVSTLSGYGPGKVRLSEYSARIAGPLLSLPAGQVFLTGVLSHREEDVGAALITSRGQNSSVTAYYPARTQSVRSAYLEVSAPIIGYSHSIPLVNSLDIQASVRRDEYVTESVSGLIEVETPDSPIPAYSLDNNRASSNDYTFGFKYKPVEGLAIRASVGSGFLPPSMAQIVGSQFVSEFWARDPKRGGGLNIYTDVVQLFGGSSYVKPEQSKSVSAGVVMNFDRVPLRLSADYTRINKTDEITNLWQQQIVDLEDMLPGRITRGERLPTDPTDYAGVITRIDGTLFNIASSEIEAWDFQAELDQDLGNWGQLRLYGIATLQSELRSQIVPNTTSIDRVGFADGPLKWRGNIGAVWKKGAWTTSVTTQWYDGYYVYSSTDGDSSRNDYSAQQGSSRISSQSYTDASTRYAFGSGFLSGAWLSLGIKNVFGSDPPILATVDSRGGYSTYGDPRGRTYVVSLQKSF